MKAALLGGVGAIALLGALHSGVQVPETALSSVLLLYGAMALLGAALAFLADWLGRKPDRDPVPRDLVYRGASVGLRNGLLVGAAYSVFRLLLHFHGQELPLWFVALYAAGVTAFFGLGLGLLAAGMTAWQIRGLK
jgi:hypothetical protein